MRSMKYLSRMGITLVTTGALAVATTGTASAVESEPVKSSHVAVVASIDTTLNGTLTSGYSSPMSASEEEQLADELEVLFTRYVQLNEADIFEVNEANLIADGHEKDLLGMQRLAAGLNALSQDNSSFGGRLPTQPVMRPLGAGEFALCVLLEGIGIPAAGASPGLVNAIKEGIRAWNWGLTAKTVARILGPSVAKAPGGPVGIGVALGWAAWSCRGKL